MAQTPQVKNIDDYAKVAPTIIKDILMDGIRKSGLPET